MKILKHRRRATVVAFVAALAMLFALPASAHVGGDPIPAPAGSDHLVKVGQFDVPFELLTSDVWALGNYAYLGSFSQPFCSFDITGTRIIDISDPTDPTLVSFIKDKQGTRTNDVKAFSLNTSKWSGDILVTTNEGCGFSLPRLNSNGGKQRAGQGGINIYDVSDPTKPHALKQNFLPKANGIHNTYAWEDGHGNAYLIAVDNIDARDVIIINITNPASPKVITRTGAPDWPGLDFSEIEGPAVFLHDVWVQENDGKTIAYLSYWDAGLVLLDVSDPADPKFLGDSQYSDPDLSGLPPEGNGHVAVPNADGSLVIFEDEDTNRFSTFLDSTIDGASGTNKVGVSLFGPNPIASFPTAVTTVGGRGCNIDPAIPAAVGGGVVLIERGECFFSEKAGNAVDAGYDGYIVYNSVAGGEGIISMTPGTPEGTEIPGLFVARSFGLDMKDALDTAKLVTADDVFGTADGEGFMRVFDVTDPEDIIEIGNYATERTLGAANLNAAGGTRDAHNVVVRGTTAYWAWYHEGIRVVDFSDCQAGDGLWNVAGCTPVELFHFGGGATPVYDFWGVYVHDIPGYGTVILGSDRGEEGTGGGGLAILETP